MISLPYPALLESIRAATSPDMPVYLVGGAVRDLLLNRPVHDLDFVLPRQGIATARRVANRLGGAFFPLDSERDAGRVVYQVPDGPRLYLDFTSYRGPDLDSDLRDRDFTVNATALDIRHPETAVDPLGGVQDIRARVMRVCSPQAFLNDPVRIVRAVRQATGLEFQIEPETRRLLRQAIPHLGNVSVERLRDELFKMLDGPRPATALRALDVLGVLKVLLPELAPLRGVQQSPPHVDDVWQHTLNTVQYLHTIIQVLQPEHDPEAGANWTLGMVSLRIGRYRQQISDHLANKLNTERPTTALLLLAALYHDTGKPTTKQLNEAGQAHFYEHEQAGARLAGYRAEQLHLSNDEIERLRTIVQHHMRPLLLAHAVAAQEAAPGLAAPDLADSALPTRRAIYRFFRATGPAGVDICLLSLADTLATYGPGIPQERWMRQLDIVRALLEAWWEHPQAQVAPPTLLSGHDLMKALDLPPGPAIGQLLEEIREAQASGEISTREQALDYAQSKQQK